MRRKKPEDGKSIKVRVNGWFDPKNTIINFPPVMSEFKKTTMVQREADGVWEIEEDRVDIAVVKDLHEGITRSLTFAQEPPRDARQRCFSCTRSQLGKWNSDDEETEKAIPPRN